MKSIVLSDFLGADFTSSEGEVDARRSPQCVNMTAGKAGRPQLRTGYMNAVEQGYDIDRQTLSASIGQAQGMHFHGDTLILHTGRLYAAFSPNETSGLLRHNGKTFISGEGSRRSASFFMNGKTYILDGSKYICYDDQNGFAEVEGFIPTTSIGRKPNGGGTSFEPVNMLTRWRKNSFSADGTSKVFILDGKADASKTASATVAGQAVEVTVSGNKATFATAPADDKGVDSVVITFCAAGEGKRQSIEKCAICSVFGAGNPTRVFVSGNADEPATDWHSGLYMPDYFPDTSYTRIGTQDTAILGYLKQYGAQIIVKEENDGQSGLFMRNAQIVNQTLADGSETESTIFTISEGAQGIGAVAFGTVGEAGGYPVFLSGRGLMHPRTDSVTNQQSLKNMSVNINGKLLGEELKDVRMTCAADKLILGVNGRVYIAKTDSEGDRGFEWFYWENIPTQAMAAHAGQLYFADEKGVYVQMSEQKQGMGAYNDLGQPIVGEWWSPVLDGGEPLREKTLSAAGTGVSFKPFLRTRAKLLIRTDKQTERSLGEYFGDIFSFADIDFNRFTFSTNDIAQVGRSERKVRKAESFQIGIRHDSKNDCFGLLGMTVSFSVGKYIKRHI